MAFSRFAASTYVPPSTGTVAPSPTVQSVPDLPAPAPEQPAFGTGVVTGGSQPNVSDACVDGCSPPMSPLPGAMLPGNYRPDGGMQGQNFMLDGSGFDRDTIPRGDPGFDLPQSSPKKTDHTKLLFIAALIVGVYIIAEA